MTRPSSPLPSLAAVQANPDLLAQLPVEGLIELRRQVGALALEFEAAITHRLAENHHGAARQAEPDRAVRLDEACTLLGMGRDYLYRHWPKLGGYRDDDGHVKFSLSTIQRHLRQARRP
jgi:hypothetical protein